ncbi:hypothetical protein SO802_010519 [Lithocarpus litseifolius]|uniref:Uncharacterized protein n=1 Tax=Lithocarpus litseifolius TaxID=425828 RepID=A0AAW2DGP6_9ROSI
MDAQDGVILASKGTCESNLTFQFAAILKGHTHGITSLVVGGGNMLYSGTTGFLTSGIRAVDPETSNCDQRKLLKEIQQMLNKALEEVKDISKTMKALYESNMAMKDELSRLQKSLKNTTEEELQSLGSMKLEE